MNIKTDKFLQTIGKEYSNYIRVINHHDYNKLGQSYIRRNILSSNKSYNLPHVVVNPNSNWSIILKSRRSGQTYGFYSGNDDYFTKYELDYQTTTHNIIYFVRNFINKGYFVYILKKEDSIRIDYDYKRKKCSIYLILEQNKNLVRRAKIREILK